MKFIKIHLFLLSILAICSLNLKTYVHGNSALTNDKAKGRNSPHNGNYQIDEDVGLYQSANDIQNLKNILLDLVK